MNLFHAYRSLWVYRLLGTFMLCLAVMSCSQELPLESEAVQAFQDNREAYTEAVAMFKSDHQLELVIHGGVNALIYAQRYDASSRVAISGEFAEKLRAIFDEAGITRIADDRGNGNLTLVPSGTAYGSTPRYYIEYVYGEAKPDAPDCHRQHERGESGQCVIQLDALWWLAYSWRN